MKAPKQTHGKTRVLQKIKPPRLPKTVHLPAPTHTMVVAREKGHAAEVEALTAAGRRRALPAHPIVIPGMGRKLGDIKFENPPALQAQSKGKPCGQKRTTCPVQLIFTRGQAQLRFCKRAGNKQPGYVVDVQDPAHAQQVSGAACAYWKAHKKSFKGFFPEDAPLGDARRRRR